MICEQAGGSIYQLASVEFPFSVTVKTIDQRNFLLWQQLTKLFQLFDGL